MRVLMGRFLVREIRVSFEELRRMKNRHEFRRLVGERLNTAYQELLSEWEKQNPEEAER